MREIFTYGSVGGASGDRCFYPEADGKEIYLNDYEFERKN